jgi:hypothetical protein
VTISELQRVLDDAWFDRSMYSLTGGYPGESFVLSPESEQRWAVYYSEHGKRTSEKIFTSEDEACRFFLEWIRRYPEARVAESKKFNYQRHG